MGWYYQVEQQQWGPVAPAQLLELLRTGTIPSSTLVRQENESEWIKASQIKSLLVPSGSLVPLARKPQNTNPPPNETPESVAPQGRRRSSGAQGRRMHSQQYRSEGRTHPLLVAIGTALLILVVLFIARLESQPKTGSDKADASKQTRSAPATTEGGPTRESVRPKVRLDTEPLVVNEGSGDEDAIKRLDRSVVAIEAAGRTGSGFIVDQKGTVVTNLHVVQDSGAAQLQFVDGSIYHVSGFVAVAPEKDLVLLRIGSTRGDFKPLPITKLLPHKGETVYALGSPRGYLGSITDGIVSAIRTGEEIRKIAMGQRDGAGRVSDSLKFSDDITWIQTSSPISPGNSGGPLVNSSGQVVGVNTWMQTDAQNLNFAVSATSLLELLAEAGEEVQPLAALPASGDDPLFVAYERKQTEEYRKQREEREAATTLQRKVATGARGRQTARIAQEIAHLERLFKQLGTEISKLESEREMIVAKRKRIRMSTKAVYLQGQNALDLMRRGQVQLNGLNKKLNGPKAKADATDQLWAEMIDKRDAIKQSLGQIRTHGKMIEKRYEQLNTQDKDLEEDLKYNFTQWQARKKELSLYEIRHGELQVQFPK